MSHYTKAEKEMCRPVDLRDPHPQCLCLAGGSTVTSANTEAGGVGVMAFCDVRS